MVRGLDTFAVHFAGEEDQYVLIGGVAAYLALEEAGLQPRATKDLDIVLCVEALTPEFGQKMWGFIDAGGYQVREKGSEPRQFYRFQKPTKDEFPVILEFFARAPGFAPLAEDAHLTPVPIDESISSLSAILLDDDYYQFIHANKHEVQGVQVVTEQCLIPLKAKAWLDLRQRKAEGNQIDSRSINKHRADIFRLVQLLVPGETVSAPEALIADIERFIADVEGEVDDNLLKGLGANSMKPMEALDAIRDTYVKRND